MSSVGRFARGFLYAGRGVARTLKTERNMRVHFTAGLCVLAFNAAVRPRAGLVALDIFVCAVVIATELVNTAVEAATDLATDGQRVYPAEVAKDAAAGAVLVVAAGAVAIALYVGFATWPWRMRIFSAVHVSGLVITSVAFLLWLWCVVGAFTMSRDGQAPA
ncbi:diacylglycerol kinase family protein [Alicyclobacillus sp. ALC3]|uniref:diacylglycerol kinase family protein n=1 Tax=Alicyclobacillus sp. ALC3 TaxID=2796143 RepID=UPI0023792043|nr:diacylglycerol kinase family protein [Alicyclobacillus sp. ALC3]WDL96343.1 diacylglycerol kinase family protein [Alicyclobacillus sp. ALC3]